MTIRSPSSAREQARAVLPMGAMTRCRMQCNLRMWTHFSVSHVLLSSAQWEQVRRVPAYAAKLEPVDLAPHFNDRVTRIFQNEYRAPRSPFVSLAMPKQGIGSWCHPKELFEVDDSGLRELAGRGGGRIELPNGVPLATPGAAAAKLVLPTPWTP